MGWLRYKLYFSLTPNFAKIAERFGFGLVIGYTLDQHINYFLHQKIYSSRVNDEKGILMEKGCRKLKLINSQK